MFEVEATGKNIEQAITNALFELKATREDVDIKILSEGGLFKKAKVKVSISADAMDKYKKEETKAKEPEKVEEKQVEEKPKVEVKEVAEEKIEETKEEKVKKTKQDVEKIEPETFLKGLFESYCKDVEIEKIETEDVITYSVKGENLSDLIGYRGETLFAISYITSVVSGRVGKRVVVDIENYREKRKKTLTDLAHKIASKVAKTGRFQKLEPMEPSERRIIHLALQDNDRVTTMSKGTEPHRYVIVFPREYKDW